jgi:hypothetical protein
MSDDLEKGLLSGNEKPAQRLLSKENLKYKKLEELRSKFTGLPTGQQQTVISMMKNLWMNPKYSEEFDEMPLRSQFMIFMAPLDRGDSLIAVTRDKLGKSGSVASVICILAILTDLIIAVYTSTSAENDDRFRPTFLQDLSPPLNEPTVYIGLVAVLSAVGAWLKYYKHEDIIKKSPEKKLSLDNVQELLTNVSTSVISDHDYWEDNDTSDDEDLAYSALGAF